MDNNALWCDDYTPNDGFISSIVVFIRHVCIRFGNFPRSFSFISSQFGLLLYVMCDACAVCVLLWFCSYVCYENVVYMRAAWVWQSMETRCALISVTRWSFACCFFSHSIYILDIFKSIRLAQTLLIWMIFFSQRDEAKALKRTHFKHHPIIECIQYTPT